MMLENFGESVRDARMLRNSVRRGWLAGADPAKRKAVLEKLMQIAFSKTASVSAQRYAIDGILEAEKENIARQAMEQALQQQGLTQAGDPVGRNGEAAR